MRAACLLATLCACRFDLPGPTPVVDGPGGDPDAPPMCADDDGDTVCDPVDQCAGEDDRLDADADATPDGCDDWPCGLKPADPGATMSDTGSGGRQWGAAFISIGTARRVVSAPGQQFPAMFTWGITIDCGAATSCRAQVEVGYGPTRLGCIFDNTVPDEQLTNSTFNSMLTAPMTPGVHELRLNAGQVSACGTSTSWYGGNPGSESTIAILCVR